MADRLFGLRHHAVVGGDHQDGDIGHIRSSRPHFGECLMTRRVDKRDASPALFDLIGADVLSNSAEFAAGNVDTDDLVQQRRLAVIDVAQKSNYGRPWDQFVSRILPMLNIGQRLLDVGGALNV